MSWPSDRDRERPPRPIGPWPPPLPPLLDAPEPHPLTPPPAPARRPRWVLAGVLFVLTFVSTTTLGAHWALATRTDVVTSLIPWLTPHTLSRVWRGEPPASEAAPPLEEPDLLPVGLAFSLPLLIILLCHELGHYLACRHYRIAATLPYFVPAPFALGTLGAFIRIRSLIRSKRELFDVGVAGPIAGFAALLPFLLYGMARSGVTTLEQVPPAPESLGDLLLVVPGHSLALTLAARLFHGPLPAEAIFDLHPFALAAWVGLLATALNLLPLGQLDGGHILYAVAGRRQRLLALPLWGALVAAGLLWSGWLLWALIVLLLGLRHPPVVDEAEPLDARRKVLALVALGIFVLSFMPVPVSVIVLD